MDQAEEEQDAWILEEVPDHPKGAFGDKWSRYQTKNFK